MVLQKTRRTVSEQLPSACCARAVSFLSCDLEKKKKKKLGVTSEALTAIATTCNAVNGDATRALFLLFLLSYHYACNAALRKLHTNDWGPSR